MTAAVYRSGTPALGVPQTQNTAPVLEFNCLYTHDIRRKQKRWRDGFLRFHTFNKRVMVYDVPRNFIGDAHWKSSGLLQDGDEVVLEKGGVIVQVAEEVGRTETDLTELRQRVKKKSSDKGSSSPVRPARPARPPVPTSNGVANTRALGLKHRSLNALLGTPKGPIGKAALPSKSPFEERQANLLQQDFADDRPTKRQRVEQPPAWNVVRTAKPTAVQPRKELPLWARTVDSAKQTKRQMAEKGQQTLATKEVIDLCEDTEEPQDRFLPGFSSDALAPLSPPPPNVAAIPQNVEVHPVRSSSPAFQTQAVPANAQKSAASNSIPRAESKRSSRTQDISTEKLMAPPERVPVERVQRQESERNDSHTHSTIGQHGERRRTSQAARSGESEAHPGRTLRIAASNSKKKTLLCQDQLLTRSSRSQSARNNETEKAVKDAPLAKSKSPKRKAKTQREQLQERLVRTAAKESVDDGNLLPADSDAVDQQPRRITGNESENGPVQPQLRSISSLPGNAIELAELDQMIMPPVRPISPFAEVSPRETRQLRRVVSDANAPPAGKSKRTPGAPVRYTPSPAKKPPSAASSVAPSDSEASPARQPPRPPPKARSKNSLQRAVSLNTTSNGTSTVILSKPFQTPKAPVSKAVEPARAPDPWSKEAFDLFTWRPPGWDEDNWCVKAGEAT